MELMLTFAIILFVSILIFVVFDDELNSMYDKIMILTLVIAIIVSIHYAFDLNNKEKAYECYVENVDEKCFFIYLYQQTEITKNGFILK